MVTPWEKMKAYEFGIVDENGKVLKKAKDLKTADEKAHIQYSTDWFLI